MSTAAVVMMIVSMLLVWGGLVASILFLRAHPQVDAVADPDLELEDAEQVPSRPSHER